MTLEQLRIFVAVAETLNMRRAAEMLRLTQPAVSAAVATLEARYDARLFDRVGRGLELSAAGRSFLPEARSVLACAEQARRVLDDLAGLVSGAVRIAASQTVATYWLPARMARFAAAHPSIDLPLIVGNTARAAAAVLAGDADVGFVEGAVDHDLLGVRVVGGDRLGLFAAPDHPLVNRPIGPDALREAIWALREPGSGTRDHFTAAIADMGLAIDDLAVRLSLPSNGAALEAAEAAGMIAAVSDLAAASRVAAGQVVRLRYDLPPRDFRLITHKSRRLSRAASAFVEALDGWNSNARCAI